MLKTKFGSRYLRREIKVSIKKTENLVAEASRNGELKCNWLGRVIDRNPVYYRLNYYSDVKIDIGKRSELIEGILSCHSNSYRLRGHVGCM